MASLIRTMSEAAGLVHDGDSVALEGFTHLICFAAGHEIIRQRRRDLTLCRLTPDLIYDQMIAAGCARKLVFSWAGNPGAGSLHAFRRAVEGKGGAPLEIVALAVSIDLLQLLWRRRHEQLEHILAIGVVQILGQLP